MPRPTAGASYSALRLSFFNRLAARTMMPGEHGEERTPIISGKIR